MASSDLKFSKKTKNKDKKIRKIIKFSSEKVMEKYDFLFFSFKKIFEKKKFWQEKLEKNKMKTKTFQ